MQTSFPDDRLDGHWKWCPDEGVLIVDARCREIQGLEEGQAAGPVASDGVDGDGSMSADAWLTLVHADDRPALRRGLAALLAGRRELHEIDLRLRRGDGSWIWVFHRAFASLGEDGTRRVVRGTLQDITGRKRQEALLRESARFLGRTGRIASVGGWQVDLAERRVTWSEETCRIHGLPPGHSPSLEEALDYFAPSARPVITACIERAVAAGKSYDVELPLIRADGRRITVRCIGSVEYRDNKPARLSGAIQDVTDGAVRRLAELGDSHRELERVNERLSLATDSGGIGIWDLDVVADRFVWDERMCAIYGLEPSAGARIDPERWLELVHEDDRAMVVEAARGAIVGEGPYELGFRVVTADGQQRELYGTARAVLGEDGRTVRLVGTNRDVTEARAVARELARQHEILKVTLRSIGDGVITTDPAGRVLWMNPVAETMVGWRVAEARGRALGEVFRIVDEETRERAPDPVRACLAEGRVTGLDADTVLIARDGTQRWIEQSAAPIRDDAAAVLGVVLVFHDVSEQRSFANEMTWRATHDELTGLVNRAEFEVTLAELRRGAARGGAEHALLFVDLDRFKIVNDTCGHAAGDLLLRQVSRLLARVAGGRDTLARLGGDEFAVLLAHCSKGRAETTALEIRDLVDAYRFVHEGQRFRVGASIGLVLVDGSWASTAAIVRAADSACYAAKEAGRNRVHLWCEADRAVHLRRTQTRWATRLETALDEDGFELHAQRIGALDTLGPDGTPGTIGGAGATRRLDGVRGGDTHAEVLVRLSDVDGTPVLPGAFLPAAERFGMVGRIDRWVLERVIGWLSAHHGRLEVDMLWVNLSGQSFGDPAFQAATLARLRTAGERICRSLCFEITETAAVTNLGDAAAFIRELRALGVCVALDDFGAGASSFGYLKSLPVDYLKIDGQFVRDLIDDPLDAAAVRCFTEVARVMNVRTVAEFVETPEVLARLREIGVDFVQGWLLHRPAPIAELLRRPSGEALVAE